MQKAWKHWSLSGALLLLCICQSGLGADTLSWNTNQNVVSADIRSLPLIRLLEGVSQVTGWQVYVESNTTQNVSSKFEDLPSGEALRHLLGDLNFALVPRTNSRPRLYVFRSSQANATLLVHPSGLNATNSRSAKIIANELTVRMKPGTKAENLACLKGAKIVGHIDQFNAYKVRF